MGENEITQNIVLECLERIMATRKWDFDDQLKTIDLVITKKIKQERFTEFYDN